MAAVLLYHFESNTKWPFYYFFILSDTSMILHLYTGSRLVLTHILLYSLSSSSSMPHGPYLHKNVRMSLCTPANFYFNYISL